MWALKHAEQYSNMYVLYPILRGVMILTQNEDLIWNIKNQTWDWHFIFPKIAIWLHELIVHLEEK